MAQNRTSEQPCPKCRGKKRIYECRATNPPGDDDFEHNRCLNPECEHKEPVRPSREERLAALKKRKEELGLNKA
jgi:hypothetical protein